MKYRLVTDISAAGTPVWHLEKKAFLGWRHLHTYYTETMARSAVVHLSAPPITLMPSVA